MSIKRNVFLTLSVQVVSFLVSLVLNLLLPKFIDQYEYSFWQTFLLYVSFVPFFHFGFLDGIMLRYSHFDYDALNKPLMRSQVRIFLFAEILLALIVVFFAFCYTDYLRLILIFVGVAVVTTNFFTYQSYLFQLTNRISKYATLVLILRLSLGLGVVIGLLMGISHFYELCFVYFAAHLIAIIWGLIKNDKLIFGESESMKVGWNEVKENVFSGAQLLVANLSAMLLIGGAKMFVQLNFDPLVFGQVAFSFNVSNLFLTFVTAASIAIFPSLKRMDDNHIPELYLKIRRSITPLLFVALLSYFPGYYILGLWLPNYHSSLTYLGVLMPLIIYTSRVTLLTNNYLKAYRKERTMLKINVVCLFVAFIMFAIATYLFNSIMLLLFSLIIVVIIHSTLSEFVVMKLIRCQLKKNIFIEFALVVVYIVLVLLFNGNVSSI